MESQRRSVEILKSRPVPWGQVELLQIIYRDGRVTYGVHQPGMLTLFGNRLMDAEDWFLRAERKEPLMDAADRKMENS